MQVSRSHLDSLLLTHVCEVRFVRRRLSPDKPVTRRMLCTKSYDLLSSTNGRIALNYRQPKGHVKINEGAKDVLVVWDILMQDYRIISMDSCELIKSIPAGEEFWKFFNETLRPMDAAQKLNFMNS